MLTKIINNYNIKGREFVFILFVIILALAMGFWAALLASIILIMYEFDNRKSDF